MLKMKLLRSILAISASGRENVVYVRLVEAGGLQDVGYVKERHDVKLANIVVHCGGVNLGPPPQPLLALSHCSQDVVSS